MDALKALWALDATEKTGEDDGKSQSHRDRERAIAALAARQHGVVATWQLAALGVTADAVRYRASIGHLHQWKLVVELDSRPIHTSPRVFENDRVRDATLQKADVRVLRVTRKRLDNAPADLPADILALRRPRP